LAYYKYNYADNIAKYEEYHLPIYTQKKDIYEKYSDHMVKQKQEKFTLTEQYLIANGY